MHVGDPAYIDAVTSHLERTVGPIGGVFHELVSDDLHIDLHLIRSDRARRFEFVCTSGMGERAMPVSAENMAFQYAELSVLLPEGWPLDDADLKDENAYWPLRLLKVLARYPHDAATWIGPGHTLATAEPPEPYAAGTPLCAALVARAVSVSEEFWSMHRPDGDVVQFYTLIPLHSDELTFARRKGSDALLDRLDKAGFGDVIQPDRPTAIGRRWLGLF